MLATMGVAAGTANAADATEAQLPKVTVTFDRQGRGQEIKTADGTDKLVLKPANYSNPTVADYTLGQQLSKLTAGKLTVGEVDPNDSTWTFTGWYDADGNKVDITKPFYKDTTLTAHWAKGSDTSTVNYDADYPDSTVYADSNQDGKQDDADASFVVANGDKLADWEKPANNDAHAMVSNGSAWNPATTDGQVLTGTGDFDYSKPVTADTTIELQYKDAQVVYVMNGVTNGSFETTNGYFTVPAAYNFTGSDADDNRAQVETWTAKVPGTETVLKADWKNGNRLPNDASNKKVDSFTLAVATSDVTKQYHKVTFKSYVADPQYAATDSVTDLPAGAVPAEYVLDGKSVQTPVQPDESGAFDVSGWKYENVGTVGTDVFDDAIKADTAVYALVRYTAIDTQVTVSFDPDYTNSKPVQVKVQAGAQPEWTEPAARDGYVFQGWKAPSGALYTKNYGFAKDSEGGYTSGTPAVYNANAYAAKDGDVLKALWLTDAQDALKQLLDTPTNVYEDNQALKDFKNAVKRVENALAYTNTGTATGRATAIEKLARATEKRVKAYTTELKALADKLVASNDFYFNDVFADGQNMTAHSGAINFLARKKIVNGYPDGGFHPTGSMTRQDFAAFLYRLAGSPEYTPTAADDRFSDVDSATPHYKEILWGVKQGVIKGYPDGTFKGMDLVNRQDAMAFFYRLAGEPEFDASKAAKTFADVDSTTPQYKEVLWAANTVVPQYRDEDGTVEASAIANGFPNNAFAGSATLLRQDGAAFIARMYAYLNK